jgi:hypothetical protein
VPPKFPTQRSLAIYLALLVKSYEDSQGRRVQEHISHEHLMSAFDKGRATIENELRRLELLGYLVRTYPRPERLPAGTFEGKHPGTFKGKPVRYLLLLDWAAVQDATVDGGSRSVVGSHRERPPGPNTSQEDTQVAPGPNTEILRAQDLDFEEGPPGEAGRSPRDDAGRGGAGAEIAEPPAVESRRRYAGGRPPRELNAAVAMLEERLASGPRRKAELEAAAAAIPVCWRTVEKARARLGIRSVQVPVPGGRGPGASWWFLPGTPLGRVPDNRRTA